MSRFEPVIPRWSTLSRSLSRRALAQTPHSERRLKIRLALERLEDRTVPSSFNLAVTSLADTGPGTLRSAITTADAGSAPHPYNIMFKVTGAIPLESALPDLSHSMNITGPVAHRLTVLRDPNASTSFGIFVVDQGVAARITGITVAHGIAAGAESGGGIDNNGTLTVSKATISANAARDGGGINNNGTLTVNHSSILGNQATGLGGGINSSGRLTVNHSTISGVPLGSNPPFDLPLRGGGIENGTTGTLSVRHTTISGNAAFNGEGIDNNGTLTLSNSSISRNRRGAFGGAIENNGTLTVTKTTISGNQCDYLGGGIDNAGVLVVSDSAVSANQAGTNIVTPFPFYPTGGGIYNDGRGAVTVRRTTISRNSAYLGEGIYNAGTLTVCGSTISRSRAGAGYSGGGIDNTGTLTVSRTTISRNSATTGGGIDNTGTLTVSHTTISRNSATTGGGLYNGGSGQAEIDYSTINDANGGGIVNNGRTVHVKKTVVDGVLYKDQFFP